MHGHYFGNFGRRTHPPPPPPPHVPDELSKNSAPRHPRFWRRFLKVFTIYGHGGHLGQRNPTILAIFHSLNLRRLHMKFEQNWPRGEVWNWTFIPYKCIRKQTWPCRKKVKCQCTAIILATLVDAPPPPPPPPSLMSWAKIQPQGILGSGEDF